VPAHSNGRRNGRHVYAEGAIKQTAGGDSCLCAVIDLVGVGSARLGRFQAVNSTVAAAMADPRAAAVLRTLVQVCTGSPSGLAAMPTSVENDPALQTFLNDPRWVARASWHASKPYSFIDGCGARRVTWPFIHVLAADLRWRRR
jgi:hypothetical protein